MVNLQSLIETRGKPVYTPGGSTLLFQDGSSWSDYIFRDPPYGPHRLQAQRRYHRLLLERLEVEGAKLEAALTGRGEPWKFPREGDWLAPHIGPPVRAGEEILSRINALANQSRAAIADIDQRLGPVILGSS